MAILVLYSVPPASAASPVDRNERDIPRNQRDIAGEEPQLPIAAAIDPTAACYPLTRPKTRRRAVGKGGPPCASNPTVRLTVEPMACEGDRVSVSWQASDSTARVHLQGVACDLPATGSMMVTVRAATTFHAIATTCGIGPEASATVAIEPRPEVTSFSGEHAMLAPNGITSLQFTYEHGTSWSIEGAQSFQNDPLAGASPFGGSARVYFASVPAEPVLTVLGRCGAAVVPLSIPRCTEEPPEVDVGQSSGGAALGQQQRWTFLAGSTITRWWIETDNGRFVPSSGARPASGLIETVYEPAAPGRRSSCSTATAPAASTGSGGRRPSGTARSRSSSRSPRARRRSRSARARTSPTSPKSGTAKSGVWRRLSETRSVVPCTLRFLRRGTPTRRHRPAWTRSLNVSTPCGPATATVGITVR